MNATTGLPVAVGVADKQLAVLDYARAEAERAGCGIKVVHAYAVPPLAMGGAYGLDIPEAYRAGGHGALAEALGHLTRSGNTRPVECVLTRGFAPSVLEYESRSSRVMIIGADESKPWYIRMFEGEAARYLVEHAECPVVVVPNSWEPSHESLPIVVMVDDEASAHGALEYAFEAASVRHSDLQVLHVTTGTGEGADAERETFRRVIDTWLADHPSVRGSSQVISGDAREVAVRSASQAGLLVLARPRERGMTSILMDSLAQGIISGAVCPVAVVPAGFGGSA